LGWKKYDLKETASKGEFKYIEVEDMGNCNLEDFGDEGLEGILINPPWGKKFEIAKFVIIRPYRLG
jgi:hypothetical protein